MSAKDADGPRARLHPSETYEILKGSVRDLVKGAGGPRRCEGITRGTESLLSRYGARQEDVHAPIDVIADLEKDIGDPIVTRMLAELQGYRLAPIATSDTVEAVLQLVVGIIGSNNDVGEGALQAAIDGHISRAEAIELRPTAILAKEKLEAWLAVLDLAISRGAR